ncbi:hypothetical protein BLOT_002074 [Blomia tropicalis]|nr:hypothetical protein BLOT_002074 [Blomia tropicalis]
MSSISSSSNNDHHKNTIRGKHTIQIKWNDENSDRQLAAYVTEFIGDDESYHYQLAIHSPTYVELKPDFEDMKNKIFVIDFKNYETRSTTEIVPEIINLEGEASSSNTFHERTPEKDIFDIMNEDEDFDDYTNFIVPKRPSSSEKSSSINTPKKK